MKKNVILSVLKESKSYPLKEFKPFIESLRSSGYTGEVIFFTNNLSQKSKVYFESKGVKLIPYDFEFPYFKDNKTIQKKFKRFEKDKLNIFHLREFLPFIYLLENKDKYEAAAIADIADVIFQKDPFKEKFDRKKTYFSLQDNKIKTAKKDCQWIRELYGKKELEKIWDNNICCTGTLIGGIKPLLDFLGLFVNEFKENTVEQANLNYLLHNNKIKNAVILNNQDGFLMTCSGGKKKNYVLGKDKKIRTKSGKVFTMIHQYDTFPQWSFLHRGVCKRSIREFAKRIPFIGDLFSRLKQMFVKSYVDFSDDKED
jgi:hypothetical protein